MTKAPMNSSFMRLIKLLLIPNFERHLKRKVHSTLSKALRKSIFRNKRSWLVLLEWSMVLWVTKMLSKINLREKKQSGQGQLALGEEA